MKPGGSALSMTFCLGFGMFLGLFLWSAITLPVCIYCFYECNCAEWVGPQRYGMFSIVISGSLKSTGVPLRMNEMSVSGAGLAPYVLTPHRRFSGV
jgi:hypothetical protein